MLSHLNIFASAGEWLNKGLLPGLRVRLELHGAIVPKKTRINRGFPPKRGWAREVARAPGVLIFPTGGNGDGHPQMGTADGYHDIFVNPRISDPLRVATIVLHHLALAALGVPPRSGGRSKRLTTYTRRSWLDLARSLDFAGRPAEMRAGPRLTEALRRILEPLGPYPEGEVERREADGPPRTRLLKIWCPTGVLAGTEPGAHNEHFQGWSTELYRNRLPRCALCHTVLVLAPSRQTRYLQTAGRPLSAGPAPGPPRISVVS